MGVQILPSYIEKYSETLESGTTWTVPAGCYYVNLTLFGGGGASGGIGAGSTAGTAGGTTTFSGATNAGGGNGGSAKSVSALTSSAGTVSGISGADGLGLGAKPQARHQYTFTSGTGITALNYQEASGGRDGQIIKSTVDTTPGASITYAIGAGGTGGTSISFPAGVDGGNGRIDIEYFI